VIARWATNRGTPKTLTVFAIRISFASRRLAPDILSLHHSLISSSVVM